MTSTTLPAALLPWAGTLDLLDPQLAIALGPMLRTIDEFVRRGDTATATSGEIDGYDGLTRRGDLSHLLMSEWALADAAPLEFLRRAAAAELLFLQRSHLDSRPRGEVVVLVDSGPEQVGAGRLVQLATLVVLLGRAERRGTDLRLGVLGDRPGEWVTGDARHLLDRWLRSRRADAPAADEVASEVDGWTEPLDHADEAWVLTGPRAAAALPGRRRVVTAVEGAWTTDGASAVDVLVDGHRAELALPHGDVAVRALRGALIRPTRTTRTPTSVTGPWVFTGASPTLLARGRHPGELLRLDVRPEARPKQHRFGGTVVTAAMAGRRLVALVERDGVVGVTVRGKHLGHIAGIEVRAADLGWAPEDGTVDFAPLVYEYGTLLTRLGGRWWRLDADTGVRPAGDVVDARAGEKTDSPAVLQRLPQGVDVALRMGDRVVARVPEVPEQTVLGGGNLLAWRSGTLRWRVGPGRTVDLDEGETPIGMHEVDDAPALVTLSSTGRVLRLRWPAGTRTLTAWSDGTGPPSVHPTRPWVAVQRGDGDVEVGDLRTGETLLRTDPA